MKRLLLALLILSSALAYDPSDNPNLVLSEKTVFVSPNTGTECAIVQNGDVKAFAPGPSSVSVLDGDFTLYCPGYESQVIKEENGPPYTASPDVTFPEGSTHYVWGQVKNEWGIPVKSLVTTFFGGFQAVAISDDSGYFAVNVPDGAQLQVRAAAHDDYTTSSSITTDKNMGTITLSTLDQDLFKTFGIADYCQEVGCSCSDYGLEDCLYDGQYICIDDGDCCPSEGNCVLVGGEFQRVDARLSVDPTELALTPGEKDTATFTLRSNMNGTYTLTPQSLNFPVQLSSSRFSLSAGLPTRGTLTVSYPEDTTVKSETVLLRMKYGSATVAEEELVVGILVPDADVEEQICREEDDRLDCTFKISNVGSFPIENFTLSVGGKTARLNLTLPPSDYIYYRLSGLRSFSRVGFSYTTKNNTWTEDKSLYAKPVEENDGETGFLETLGEVFKSIFG